MLNRLINPTSSTAWNMALLAAVLIGTAWLLLRRKGRTDDAPQVPGLPVIGNAMALGRHGVAYINKCRQKYGDTFSLNLVGQKITFLFEPAHIDYFFAAPDEKITFRPAVEQFTQRVFGLTSRLFFPLHFKMLTELRHLLVPAALSEHMQVLGARALELLPCYVHHAQVDLYSLCRGLVFQCAVETIFGRPFVEALGTPAMQRLMGARDDRNPHDLDLDPDLDLDQTEEEEAAGGRGEQGRQGQGAEGAAARSEACGPSATAAAAAAAAAAAGPWGGILRAGETWRIPPRPPAGLMELARAFYAFEEEFELAASPLPHALLPHFQRCRALLLRVLAAADRKGLFSGTPAGQLLERTTGLPHHLRPNLLLALLWASQANTVPATFWATAFLILPENQGHRALVLEELQAELSPSSSGNAAGAPPSPAGVGASALPSGYSLPVPLPYSPSRPLPANAHEPPAADLVAAAAHLAASRRSAVSRCVAEALRLRVQSIDVRLAASPLDLPTSSSRSAAFSGPGAGRGSGAGADGGRLRIPRGRLLAVCPFESHHDDKLYGSAGSGGGQSDPWAYDPNRPELRLGDGSAVVASVSGLAFGGGPYRCPGRFFAEQELGLLVQLLLWSYDMQLSYGDASSRSANASTNAAAEAEAAGTTAPGGQVQVQASAHSGAPAVAPAATSPGPSPRPSPGPGPGSLRRTASQSVMGPEVPPQPQLEEVQGGSLLYGALAQMVGHSALAWGCGWFDGLDGPMQDWSFSGDPAGLLPPCDLRRLVGIKVPRKPCWVQLGYPLRASAGKA